MDFKEKQVPMVQKKNGRWCEHVQLLVLRAKLNIMGHKLYCRVVFVCFDWTNLTYAI